MQNVINMPNRDTFYDLLEDLRRLYAADRITDFVMMARVETDRADSGKATLQHWFGRDSTLYCRGMLRRLDDAIKDYMDEADEADPLDSVD